MTEKKTIIEIENVRIKEYNEMNVMIERKETYFNPLEKKEVSGWKFRGYSTDILAALKSIHNKGLLINTNAITDLENHLKEVDKANKVILDALERMKNEIHRN